jgi:hypothetical protein
VSSKNGLWPSEIVHSDLVSPISREEPLYFCSIISSVTRHHLTRNRPRCATPRTQSCGCQDKLNMNNHGIMAMGLCYVGSSIGCTRTRERLEGRRQPTRGVFSSSKMQTNDGDGCCLREFSTFPYAQGWQVAWTRDFTVNIRVSECLSSLPMLGFLCSLIDL